MKKFLLMMAVAMLAMSLNAAPVDQATAFRKAKSFLSNELYAGKLMAPAALNPVLLKAETGAKMNQPVYYIYNTSTTFLVIAGDDRAEEILMVGDAPLKDINHLAPGMQDMLAQYKEEIQYLQEHPGLKVDPIPASQLAPSLRASTYGPLLSCNWDQTAPYWNLCKFTYNSTSYQCYTGCPATSAAMVMYYWRFPTTPTGNIPAYSNYLELTSTNQVYYSYPALTSTTFDWNNMKDTYYSYNNAQANAVATLMRYVGQVEKMSYGTSAAGGSGISVYSAENVATMFEFFGYNESTTRLVKKSSYSDTQWASLLQTEMSAGRPVVYMGVSAGFSGGGHAFNVDGYRSSDSKYHINFGWSGDGNSWCALNSFGYSSYNFSSSQQMVIGIEPGDSNPTLVINPASLSFTGCYPNETYTKTFTLRARNLTNNVNLSVSGEGFTVSPTTISKTDAQNGVEVTVTYSSPDEGTHSGTVTVTSSGAETKTVSLSGSTQEVPTLIPSVSVVTMTTTVGGSANKTFKVRGTNLVGNVTLSITGTGFTVTPTSITRAKASTENGATVTVTYRPTEAGNHMGNITITSQDAEIASVVLNGTATDNTPTLNVDPTSLSFTGEAGHSYTKSFDVSGANLTGDLTLTLNNANGVYSIDKTSITASQAASGTTVNVTYAPNAAGSQNASVTISGGGVASKTVSLSGTATEPVRTINVDPSSLSFSGLVDEVMTKTFTVTGDNLNGNLTLALNGANGVYSITPTTITAAEAAEGKMVTVTYSPTAAGNHNATVTVSGGGADSKTVTLNGTAAEPVRTITATPSSLIFNNVIGETTSQTFIVTGENLKGSNLTLSLNDQNGVFSIEPTTISLDEAAAGKTVIVTYAPEAFGNHSATITISGGSANPVTVTLAGQANITKYAPVMLEPNDLFVAIDRFRAEWMDQTPETNVSSYTLEVNAKVVEPELLGSVNGSSYTNQSYQAISLSAPWSSNNLYGGYGAIYFRNATHSSATTDGYIKYTIPAGYQNTTFTVKLTTATGQYGSGRFVVGSAQTAAVEYNMSAGGTHGWLVTGSTGDVITITSPEDQYSPDIAKIEIYSGDATDAKLMASETGGPNYRLITEIDPENKFYTVENLTEGGTFLYRVKALYIDGTESDWSNVQEVTLHENDHPYQVGDVNHDTFINVSDVTALIAHILGTNDAACPLCGNLDGNDAINVADVTALITFILNGGNQANMPAPTVVRMPR